MPKTTFSKPHVTLLTALAVLLLGAAAARAEPAACRVEPFGQTDGAAAEHALAAPCGGEHVDWKLETPRAHPLDAGPSLLRARIDTSVSEPLAPAVQGTLKLSWVGLRDERQDDGELRTQRAELAAGSLLRLDDDIALQFGAGRDVLGEGRNRTTLAGLWQPTERGVLFAEWAGSEGQTDKHRVGARWWLAPQRVSVDVGASRLPDGQWSEQRVGLTVRLGR